MNNRIAAYRTFELAKSAAQLVRSDLIPAGIMINKDKNDFFFLK